MGCLTCRFNAPRGLKPAAHVHLLVHLRVFNTEQMPPLVFATHYGLYDTVVAKERGAVPPCGVA